MSVRVQVPPGVLKKRQAADWRLFLCQKGWFYIIFEGTFQVALSILILLDAMSLLARLPAGRFKSRPGY